MQSMKSADSFLPKRVELDNAVAADQALEALFSAEGSKSRKTPYLLPEYSYDNLPPLVVPPINAQKQRTRDSNSFWPAMCINGRLLRQGAEQDHECSRKLKDFMPVKMNYSSCLKSEEELEEEEKNDDDQKKYRQDLDRLPDFIAELKNNPLEFSGEVCRTCSKVISDSSRRGSITAWLFKDDTCTCLNSDALIAHGLSDKLIFALQDSCTTQAKERYELLQPIGQGAMGWVYKALDTHTGVTVAIKVLRAELVSDGNMVRRFRQEVDSTASLCHPNLVRIHGYATSKIGAPYIVMDYLKGENLQQMLQREGALAPVHAMPILFGIANGLSELHKHGVIHRDLKPSNIVFSDTKCDIGIKIVDFGFAKVLEDEAEQRLTQTGEAFGSPQYMSPEQCLGQTVDERSDIYSFGCLMYEVLSGQPPVVGKNVLATVAKQVKENAVSLCKKNKDFPVDLDEIVLTCLHKNRSQRYQSVEEVLADLRNMHAGLPINGITGSTKGAFKMKPSEYDMQMIQIMFGLVLLCAISMITALAVRNILG